MGKGYHRPPSGSGGMLQQIQRLQQQILEAQERLAQMTVTSSAGGGVVKVTLTGDQRCQAIEVAPELLQEGDAEMLQDLLLTAINMALEQSRQLQKEIMGPLAGNLPF